MAESPVILAVDDDLPVLAAVVRDLQNHYGERFRTLRASSGESALETLRQLQLRNTPVALFVVDQRMPGMSGVEFLREAIALFPQAKKVLLTAYADTSVAIQAINDIGLDHYLLKPWDPPEEQLFPVLDDLLEAWTATYSPPFEGLRVIGHRWSAQTFELKDFLSRNLVPYQWLDVEASQEALALLGNAGADQASLPVVVLPDGSVLTQPSTVDVAQRIGLDTTASLPFYDLIIVGAGPSGLAAAVYGASEGLRTLMIEREGPGGQAGTSSRIENYLGFPSGLSGADLARRAVAQARRFGAEIMTGEVVGMRVEGQYRIVSVSGGAEISCHALLVTAGVSYRRLDVPGIERLTGAGVYYGGALSEAIASKDEDVFIVGGGNSAGQAAVYFATYARCVTMLVRGNDLGKAGMSQYLIDRIEQTPNIQVRLNANVVEAIGETRLEGLRIADSVSGSVEVSRADGLFIFIGAQPYTDWTGGLLAHDQGGYLLTGPDLSGSVNGSAAWPLQRAPFYLETNVPGIFTAGDIRHHSIKRIASATGEGAMAVSFVHQYLGGL